MPMTVSMKDPNYRPDYFAAPQQVNTNADYIVGREDQYQNAWSGLPNYYDWVNWYNEMMNL